MNPKIEKLAKQAGYYLYDLTETHQIKTVETDEANEWITLEKFAELILQAAADHIMESSDRYRKEYFADKVLDTFAGDGGYEIGTMEGLKEFEDKRNAGP